MANDDPRAVPDYASPTTPAATATSDGLIQIVLLACIGVVGAFLALSLYLVPPQGPGASPPNQNSPRPVVQGPDGNSMAGGSTSGG